MAETTKLICALHGDGLDDLLRSNSLRDELRAAGATRLQVNIDDRDVAGAMRFGPGKAVTGVVSVWTDAERDMPALTHLVATIGAAVAEPDLHAYRVTEKVRLDPAPSPDGVRADVLAQVALLRRPPTMSPADYLEYWLVQHTPIAIRTQNTSAYIQNIVESPLTPTSPPVAAIVEEHFPMAAISDPHAFYGSRGDEAERKRRVAELMQSVHRFGADDGLDLVPSSRYQWVLRP